MSRAGRRARRSGHRWPDVTPPRRRTRGGGAREAVRPGVATRRLDGAVVAATATLAGLGVVMIYSATAPLAMGRTIPPHFTRHVLALAAGVGCAAVALRIPLVAWRRLALPLWGASAALLAATLLLGVEVKAATRWLELPGLGMRFQPAELAKWATVLAVAAVLARRDRRGAISARQIRSALALGVLPAALLLRQPDFGNAVLLVALVGMLLYAAGAPLARLLLPAAAAGGGGALFVLLHPYALRRLLGFLDPWERAQSEGFQLVQSFVAFGRGGALGVGVGGGRQKLGFLPEVHTDFILSVVAEELGLIGVLLVLGAFTGLALAGLRIAGRARDPFALLVALGMTGLVALPAAVNGAVVMGAVPTTGFTLPFLSYGRTSLVVCALAVGILLRVGACEAAPRQARVAGAAPRGWARG